MIDGRGRWMTEAELLKMYKSGQFPDEPAETKDTQDGIVKFLSTVSSFSDLPV